MGLLLRPLYTLSTTTVTNLCHCYSRETIPSLALTRTLTFLSPYFVRPSIHPSIIQPNPEPTQTRARKEDQPSGPASGSNSVLVHFSHSLFFILIFFILFLFLFFFFFFFFLHKQPRGLKYKIKKVICRNDALTSSFATIPFFFFISL